MAVILDYTGVSILANKGDGTTEDVTALCTFDPPDGTEVTTPGRILVKATYTENSGTDNEQTFDTYFEIGVGAIVCLDVTQTPDKMAYYVGEFIDLTGMIVTAFLSDGSTADVTADCTTIPPDGTEVLTEGHIIVDVLYKDGQGAGQFELTVERGVIDGGDYWTLWSDGELEIFCDGDMPNYGSIYYNHPPWYDHRDKISIVSIADSVTSISSGAFYSCSCITDINIPDSVRSIGSHAFEYCSRLTNIVIPDRVSSISTDTFSGCTSLANVVIPDNVTFIGNEAFRSCSSLTSIAIPENVTHIGESAFSSCRSLTSITIPNKVTAINQYTFAFCTNLESVTMASPSSVASISAAAFEYSSNLASIAIPDSVTSIDNNAFYKCSGLTEIIVDSNNSAYSSIDGILFNKNQTTLVRYPQGKQSASYTIPNSVTSIAASAFRDCSNLTNVIVPDSVSYIGNSVFSDCTNLTSVSIPNGVTTIYSGTFYECSSLSSMTIPNSVTAIGDNAFCKCSDLASVTIPDSVISISVGAFYQCSSLRDVYYTGTQSQWEQISIGSNNSDLTSATIHYNSTGPA